VTDSKVVLQLHKLYRGKWKSLQVGAPNHPKGSLWLTHDM